MKHPGNYSLVLNFHCLCDQGIGKFQARTCVMKCAGSRGAPVETCCAIFSPSATLHLPYNFSTFF